jgi:SnoaL-like polyketide cyclase
VSEASSPLAVLKLMVEAFCTGDTSTVREFVSAEYVDHQGLGGEPMCGADGFAHVVTVARGGYRSLDVSVVSAETTTTTVEGRLAWHGERRDGSRVSRETVETLRVVEGKAIEHWGRHL